MGDIGLLNEFYGAGEDPWHMRDGWLAHRKRELMLAALPNARYEWAFEPGCSHGELTTDLARRCDNLLSVDSYWDGVAEAAQRTAHLSNVVVEHRHLPAEWPTQQFDLVVLNEIGSMSASSDWAKMAELVKFGLTRDATVLACHWRHDFPGRTLQLETLHGVLDSLLGLPRQSRVDDADFTVVVWTTRPRAGRRPTPPPAPPRRTGPSEEFYA